MFKPPRVFGKSLPQIETCTLRRKMGLQRRPLGCLIATKKHEHIDGAQSTK
jgi:hypothetical protein